MTEPDVKFGLACILKLHAVVKNGTLILNDDPLKAQQSRKLHFQHLCRGQRGGGVHKGWEGLNLRDLTCFALLLNLILLLNNSCTGVALSCWKRNGWSDCLYTLCTYSFPINYYSIHAVFLFLLSCSTMAMLGRSQMKAWYCGLLFKGFWKNNYVGFHVFWRACCQQFRHFSSVFDSETITEFNITVLDNFQSILNLAVTFFFSSR